MLASTSHTQSYINKYNSINIRKSNTIIKQRKRSIVRANQANHDNPSKNVINSFITTSLAITLSNVISNEVIAQPFDIESIQKSHQNQIATLIQQNDKKQDLV